MQYDGTMSWAEYQQLCNDFIHALLDDMTGYLKRGDYLEVDKFLSVAPVEQTDPIILREILRTTKPYSDLLTERIGFYYRVRDELRKTCSERDTSTLLEGLI